MKGVTFSGETPLNISTISEFRLDKIQQEQNLSPAKH